MKRPTARELEAAATALLRANPEPPQPDPDVTNVTPFRRHSALDWLESPARGESRLNEMHLLAADLFTRDLDAGAVASPAEQTMLSGVLVLNGDPADPGYRAWQTERRRERAALRVAERERRGELNLLTVRPTGDPGAAENDVEARLLARAWRKSALRRRLGSKGYGVLTAVLVDGQTIRGLMRSDDISQRQATRLLLKALDDLVAAYESIDETFAAEAARWRSDRSRINFVETAASVGLA